MLAEGIFVCWLQWCSKGCLFCQSGLQLSIFPLGNPFFGCYRGFAWPLTVAWPATTALSSPCIRGEVTCTTSDQPSILSPRGRGNTGDLPKHTTLNRGRMCGRKSSTVSSTPPHKVIHNHKCYWFQVSLPAYTLPHIKSSYLIMPHLRIIVFFPDTEENIMYLFLFFFSWLCPCSAIVLSRKWVETEQRL